MNLKQTILRAVDALGLNRWARFRTRRRLLGICYHGIVSDDSPDDARTRIAVSASQFELQLRELRNHWTPISLERIRQALYENRPLPDRAVHVSFDDGYRNNLTLAAPLLAKYEIPATIFITTDFLDSGRLIWPLELHERIVAWPNLRVRYAENRAPLTVSPSPISPSPPNSRERSETALAFVNAVKRLDVEDRDAFLAVLRSETELNISSAWQRELYEPLQWSELPLLKSMGIDLGAHTLTHPNLAKLPLEELEKELRESKARLEREAGSEPCDSLAYPFGSGYDYSDSVVDAARRIGFRLAFTLQERRNGTVLDPLRIHRICIHREHSPLSFRTLISGLRNS